MVKEERRKTKKWRRKVWEQYLLPSKDKVLLKQTNERRRVEGMGSRVAADPHAKEEHGGRWSKPTVHTQPSPLAR